MKAISDSQIKSILNILTNHEEKIYIETLFDSLKEVSIENVCGERKITDITDKELEELIKILGYNKEQIALNRFNAATDEDWYFEKHLNSKYFVVIGEDKKSIEVSVCGDWRCKSPYDSLIISLTKIEKKERLWDDYVNIIDGSILKWFVKNGFNVFECGK